MLGFDPQVYQKITLDNGLRIFTIEMPHVRSISTGFFLGVGSRYEEDRLAGASHFIEHMLFKGTERRPDAREIATAIEGIGGVFNGSTGRELTVYWAKVAQEHLLVALDVLVDMLRHALFEPAQVEKERRVIMEEINITLDSPSDLVHLLINQLVWPDHPLGRDVAGTKESVANMGREDVLAYMHSHYGPANTVVGVAGNIDHDQTVKRIADYLGDWQGGGESDYLPVTEEQKEPRLHIYNKDTEQAHLCLSVPGLHHTHPDRFILRLLNTILGEGMSSRLFLEIREKRGLAYSVNSHLSYLKDAGASVTYAGVDPQNAPEAIQAILGEWDRLRQELVPAEELSKAKEYVKGRTVLQMEDTYSNASWLAGQELLTGEILTVEEVLDIIDSVTADEVQRVAQKLFVGDKLNLAVVGPFDSEREFEHLLVL